MSEETMDRLGAWLDAVEAASPESWQALPDLDHLPEHVRADSQYWCDEVFTAEANPHDAPGARHRICPGAGGLLDLLAHDYRAEGLDLSVIEGRNFVLVRVGRQSLDLMAIPEAERHLAVERAAAAVFRAPLRFLTCAALGEGAMVCTDESADPLLVSSWARRAEGGIRGGELWFVCYKRNPQRVGFANAAQWFSDQRRG